MRYESPLDPDEFRRPEQQGDARRITIRPNAGRAVGTTARVRLLCRFVETHVA